jgi:hypothetical protein
MPYKSKAQQRAFHAMEARGQISPSVVKEFDQATTAAGGFKRLPERVKPKVKKKIRKR